MTKQVKIQKRKKQSLAFLNDLPDDKASLRGLAKKAIVSILADQKHSSKRVAKLIEKIQELEIYRQARTVMIYSAMEDEIDLQALVQADLDSDFPKTWVLPRAIGSGRMLCFELDSYERTIESQYGIMVPPSTNRLVDPEEIDLVIVPALMFDTEGYRLGRGAGYYDSFLSKHEIPTIGVSMAELVIDLLPHEEHDIKVNRVLLA